MSQIKGKLFPPRFFDGREFELWTKKVSASIGVDAPATMEELAEQSLTPIMSRLADLERRVEQTRHEAPPPQNKLPELERKIEELENKIATVKAANHELQRKIDDLERSL
jgi:septal ring factor EnvC (AmiA/AmiB activator)